MPSVAEIFRQKQQEFEAAQERMEQGDQTAEAILDNLEVTPENETEDVLLDDMLEDMEDGDLGAFASTETDASSESSPEEAEAVSGGSTNSVGDREDASEGAALHESSATDDPIEAAVADGGLDDEDTEEVMDQDEEVIDPLTIEIDDSEIKELDKIDSTQFTKDRSERYKTILHSEVLVSLEQNLQATSTTYERKAIWTTHNGAIMTAEYALTDMNPKASLFIRNSYNGMYALGMIVGIDANHMYVFNDYRAIHRRHTINADINELMGIAVGEITTEYTKGKTLLAIMDNTLVQKEYDHVAMSALTQRDVLWHVFLEDNALPITLLPKAVREYNTLVDDKQDVTLLKLYQIMATQIKKQNTRDRVVKQHRELMRSIIKSYNAKKGIPDGDEE
ncbi:MAG: hypothetical protein CMB80_05795 [Flammeovirgaceae bacterium]|nr:hypothetical protein [Flammeovirgaceae bacterium]|tara:strand:- start:414 stop:1592 length:1179 start_codon:yes stop_codon:yes gene_type:complete